MTGPLQNITGCIFNMDGVLVNTGKYNFQAWRRLANKLGFDLSEEQNVALKGYGRMASLEKILEWGDLYMPEAEKMYWADVKNNWYLELIANMKPGEVLPGVLFFLRQLSEMGIKLALSSSSQNARSVLKSTNIESFFQVIVDGNSVKKQKPHPQCFLQAANAMQLNPEACMVFEDAPLGIDAALAGGFITVGVGGPESLSKAHLIIDGFENTSFNTLLAQLTARVAP